MTTPPGDPVHVVLGDSAGGCLRHLIRTGRLPGTVVVVPEDLSWGPLDPAGRMDFWRRSYRGYLADDSPEWLADPWAGVDRAAADGAAGDLVIWRGDNPADAVLLAAVCDRLPVPGSALWQVNVSRWTDGVGPHYVPEFEPDVLAGAWPVAVAPVSMREREHHATRYRELMADGHMVRRFVAGEVVGLPADAYDAQLLAACPSEWRRAARAVGEAMGACDPDNKMSDLFFSTRLQHLIESGEVEVEGDLRDLRSYRVRRAAAPSGE